MSTILASAMLLQCFFNRPADGSVAAHDVPVIKMQLSPEMAESFITKQPPISRISFVGENEPAREWVIGKASGATAASFQLLRVSLSDAPLSPSAYSARFGAAIRSDDGAYRFENKMAGYCELLPSEGGQQ